MYHYIVVYTVAPVIWLVLLYLRLLFNIMWWPFWEIHPTSISICPSWATNISAPCGGTPLKTTLRTQAAPVVVACSINTACREMVLSRWIVGGGRLILQRALRLKGTTAPSAPAITSTLRFLNNLLLLMILIIIIVSWVQDLNNDKILSLPACTYKVAFLNSK